MRYLVERRGCSQRRACRLVRLPRRTARYTAKVRVDEAELVKRLKEIAVKHRRFGYRRAWAMLRRDKVRVNPKRVYRLWKKEGLLVRRPVKKKRLVETRQEKQLPPVEARYPDHVWTVDFVADQTVTGRKLRMLSVTDEFTRQSLGIEVGASLTGQTVAQVLGRLFASRGKPAYLRSDNGPEFVSLLLRGFLWRSQVETVYIAPGSPWQNGFAESFHSRFRDEFLNAEVFLSVLDAQVRVERWRTWYNRDRPHSSLKYQTPDEFAASLVAGGGRAAETNFPRGT